MKNNDKYKTLEEREAAFKKFCYGDQGNCETCPLHGMKKITIFGSCALQWLELDADEKPKEKKEKGGIK